MQESPIILRSTAKKLGLKVYFTGKPCIRGHISERRTKNCMCVQCDNDNCKKWGENNTDWVRTYSREYMRQRMSNLEIRNRTNAQVRAREKRKREEIAGGPRPNICEVCNKYHKKIVFDHDHTTGEFRGWLCDSCNRAIGLMGDSIERLTKMLAYLKRYQDKKLAAT